jgi:hypothetical protein
MNGGGWPRRSLSGGVRLFRFKNEKSSVRLNSVYFRVDLPLLVPSDCRTATGAVFLGACVRLDQSVVGSNAGLSVYAPILVIANGLDARIMWCGRELTFPGESRTEVRTVPVKPYGVCHHRWLLHERTPLEWIEGTFSPAASRMARFRATRAI